MSASPSRVAQISHFIHEHFIKLLLACYLIAAVLPVPGLAIRDGSAGTVKLLGEVVKLSCPLLMLSFLLFNAGFGIKASQLKGLKEHPATLIGGMAVNILAPILFILTLYPLTKGWHSQDEIQNILVGLSLIASMPIAGSSTAWSQNANGNLALSVGLVLLSTLLSPIATPLALHTVSFLTTGDYAEDLKEIATSGTKLFLTICVIAPVILGLIGRKLLGETRVAAIAPVLKLCNSIVLLTLIYSNSAISLPQVLKNPDWDFLLLILLITGTLCASMFATGYWLSKLCKVNDADRTSLMFALGMSNNGTGLVLAATALSDHPDVLLAIIAYNLIQHLVAGLVDQKFCRQPQ